MAACCVSDSPLPLQCFSFSRGNWTMWGRSPEELLSIYQAGWKKYGCTIMSNGWSDRKTRELDKVVQEIGEEHAVQVVTDTASAYVHSRKRNRLEQKRLNDLVFVQYNQCLRETFLTRQANPYAYDPISFDEVDDYSEWIIGLDPDEQFGYDGDLA
ncbi:hypothetical protein F0562_017511 [Nyssa sinensis]|uniref:DUF659 domain-containing protein n=1 Tax=Nyssa sinensis TaxID=561372 RepID=A0A5J4ZI65_9ASTE|nr:hypothetical protein F0562_017511 [Nyssa sinensis]